MIQRDLDVIERSSYTDESPGPQADSGSFDRIDIVRPDLRSTPLTPGWKRSGPDSVGERSSAPSLTRKKLRRQDGMGSAPTPVPETARSLAPIVLAASAACLMLVAAVVVTLPSPQISEPESVPIQAPSPPHVDGLDIEVRKGVGRISRE